MRFEIVFFSAVSATLCATISLCDVNMPKVSYTTLPYSEEEWRAAMREMVSEGIIPVFLPQFDHMRDILLNPHYGREYQMHYNLDKPTKGMMVHCLIAAYPWWKATYEEGGAPGIIWSDYMCDGFATETQKRELKLLIEQFDRMQKLMD